jgi:probable rRNA maturation factor
MIEVEVFGIERVAESLTAAEVRDLCLITATNRGISDGHVAVEFVDEARITELNDEHRGKQAPTDVLSFPIDGIDAIDGGSPLGAPCELGDVVICPQHTIDLREAIVHGMLHLLGMDHERDDGEMLALQVRLLSGGR